MNKKVLFRLISCLLTFSFVFITLCACQNADNNKNSEEANKNESVSVTPTGRDDGMSELTHLYYNDRLYIQSSYGSGIFFDEVNEKTELEYVGEVLKNDNNKLPSENFASYLADVGDKIYKNPGKDELYIRLSNDRVTVLIPAE
ncbi:MAG: hypothetical protein ACI4F5_02910 [Acutalibacteraceae bacterium]